MFKQSPKQCAHCLLTIGFFFKKIFFEWRKVSKQFPSITIKIAKLNILKCALWKIIWKLLFSLTLWNETRYCKNSSEFEIHEKRYFCSIIFTKIGEKLFLLLCYTVLPLLFCLFFHLPFLPYILSIFFSSSFPFFLFYHLFLS